MMTTTVTAASFVQGFLYFVGVFFVLYLIGYSTFLFLSVTVGSSILYRRKREAHYQNQLMVDCYVPISIIMPAHNENVTVEKLGTLASDAGLLALRDRRGGRRLHRRHGAGRHRRVRPARHRPPHPSADSLRAAARRVGRARAGRSHHAHHQGKRRQGRRAQYGDQRSAIPVLHLHRRRFRAAVRLAARDRGAGHRTRERGGCGRPRAPVQRHQDQGRPPDALLAAEEDHPRHAGAGVRPVVPFRPHPVRPVQRQPHHLGRLRDVPQGLCGRVRGLRPRHGGRGHGAGDEAARVLPDERRGLPDQVRARRHLLEPGARQSA